MKSPGMIFPFRLVFIAVKESVVDGFLGKQFFVTA